MRRGDHVSPRPTKLDSSNVRPPHALGAAIEVPFINWRLLSVQVGTGATAPPGAETLTNSAPSVVGPRDDHVYWMSESLERSEYLPTEHGRAGHAAPARDETVQAEVRGCVWQLRLAAASGSCVWQIFFLSFSN